MTGNGWEQYIDQPQELLKELIRFDTTNPPGGEGPCMHWIKDLLESAGFDPQMPSLDPDRPNVVARLEGRGQARPFLMYGHADVVTTEGQDWTHPPFEGVEADGYIWGRGALDMKSGLAMMISALLRAKAEGLKPAGDVILAVVSDEEDGGRYGARFLAEEHPGLFENARYAIGEFGGFRLNVSGRRFYPVMVGEKQVCWMKAIVRGPGGHGSQPMSGGAMAKVGELLTKLDSGRLPVHITNITRMMVEEMASALGTKGMVLRQLLNPRLTDMLLNRMGEQAKIFEPLLRNTVNATKIRGGSKINVIPSEIELELDGRLLPGYKPYDMLTELRDLIGSDVDLEVTEYDPCPPEPDMGLFDTIREVLKRSDPEGVTLPLLMSGTSDARFFSQLGIQTYGFLPMDLPEDFQFTKTIHAADERIPSHSVSFGTDAIYRLLGRFKD
jgi:acetylornithine deacetylase/succinyl-diaminopimelate desuccinylase-like protein